MNKKIPLHDNVSHLKFNQAHHDPLKASVVLVDAYAFDFELTRAWVSSFEHFVLLNRYSSIQDFMTWASKCQKDDLQGDVFVVISLTAHLGSFIKPIDWIKKHKPFFRFIALISSIDDLVIHFIANHVDGVISRMDEPRALIHAVETIQRDGRYLSPSIDRAMLHLKTRYPAINLLTKREIEVMRKVFKGYPIKSIAFDDKVKPQTISVLQKRVKSKLGDRTLFEIYDVFKRMNMLE